MTLNRTRMTRIWLICADKAEKSGFFPLHPHNPRSILSLSDRLLTTDKDRIVIDGLLVSRVIPVPSVSYPFPIRVHL